MQGTCDESAAVGLGPSATTLIREMEHRIKNHLQLLASYTRLASRRRGLTVGELADDLADKLVAVADAHDALYRCGGVGGAPALPFLRTLLTPFEPAGCDIFLACDPDLVLPADELAPVGMIVSEAVSNAIKHAFPGQRERRIWVRLAEADGSVALTIRDNGVGIGDQEITRVSGLGLIAALAKQLNGESQLGDAPLGGSLISVAYPQIPVLSGLQLSAQAAAALGRSAA